MKRHTFIVQWELLDSRFLLRRAWKSSFSIWKKKKSKWTESNYCEVNQRTEVTRQIGKINRKNVETQSSPGMECCNWSQNSGNMSYTCGSCVHGLVGDLNAPRDLFFQEMIIFLWVSPPGVQARLYHKNWRKRITSLCQRGECKKEPRIMPQAFTSLFRGWLLWAIYS